ncbi:putative polyketide synthase [Trichinella spiralis]|uniref:Polyketide synthase n=1 Tax=Trichinella spiralis TaxID=6334 RepID=A0ABR3K4W1_TRISP
MEIGVWTFSALNFIVFYNFKRTLLIASCCVSARAGITSRCCFISALLSIKGATRYYSSVGRPIFRCN